MSMKKYLSIFLALAVLAACQKEEPLLTGPVGGNGQEETGGNGGGDGSGSGDDSGNGDNGGENEGGDNGGSGNEGGDVIPPATTGYAWFELPAIVDENKDGKLDDGNELYYAHHLCAGGERSGGKTARNYTVCYSGVHHCPMWVAAPRHKMYVGKSGRNDSYRRDPYIPADIQYSSKSTGGGCNKGHMLGSAERTSSKPTNQQVFYYTNIAPQFSDTFNTGGAAWNSLEDHVDNLVCADTLYEVVGCYFEKYTDAYGKSCEPQTIFSAAGAMSHVRQCSTTPCSGPSPAQAANRCATAPQASCNAPHSCSGTMSRRATSHRHRISSPSRNWRNSPGSRTSGTSRMRRRPLSIKTNGFSNLSLQ